MYKTVKVSELKDLTLRILTAAGETEEDALLVFENLLEDEYMGRSSHGFNRIPNIAHYSKNRSKRVGIKIDINDNIISVDGQENLSFVAVRKACNSVVSLAQTKNVIVAGVYNYVGETTGALGYYTRYMAKCGLVNMMFCRASSSVAPYGSMEPHIGTNPISFAFPNADSPVVTDVSTAAMSYGQLAILDKSGKKIPEGIILNKDGYPTTDPGDMIRGGGVQLPLAGHKGYALGIASEILAGLFIGTQSGNGSAIPEGTDGTLIVAFKPDLFVGKEAYERNIGAFLGEVKNAKPAPGASGVRIPGQYDTAAYEAKKASGEITILTKVYEDILACL